MKIPNELQNFMLCICPILYFAGKPQVTTFIHSNSFVVTTVIPYSTNVKSPLSVIRALNIVKFWIRGSKVLTLHSAIPGPIPDITYGF